ncbi:MAG: hypothetical protein EAZ08_08795 [Cytophagales bacterium]|nr:MAG: hypothetical protein EAZ08_08795 [Cytophagales bacterium]
MINNSNIQSFEIRFETSENTPPPYSYTYILKGTPKEQHLALDYQIVYTLRDDLSVDEIVGQGFSLNDDIDLDGEVSALWTEQFSQLLKKTKISTKRTENSNANFLEIDIVNELGEKSTFSPVNHEQWEYLCEELSQALLEVRQVERPLLLRFKKISPNEYAEFQFITEFSKRSVLIKSKAKNAVAKEVSLSWQEGKDFLELVFKPDYFVEEAQTDEPISQNGFFINIGDEFWYEAGQSLMNRSEKVNLIAKIEKQLNDFFV